MLNPDVSKTQAALQANANAAASLTNYAQATITAVPRVPNPPGWFAPMQADLATAQGHAQGWLQNICPAVTGGVPQSVVDFNGTFQSKSQQILDIQAAIDSGGGQPTALQRSMVSTLLADLSQAFARRSAAVTALQGDIKSYSTNVKNDQDALQADLATVSNRFVSGHTWVQQLTAAIGENFLDTQVLGPCTSIVQIDINVSLQVGGVPADPTLILLVFAKSILENQIDNSQAAQQAIQAVLDAWTTLKVKADAVAADLKDAEDSEYLAVLSQIDLETAQTQWQQLSDFASGLLSQLQEGGTPSSDSLAPATSLFARP